MSTVDYDAQLHAKALRVEFAFKRHAFPLALPAIAPIAPASPTLGYRTRAKYVVADDVVGLYAPGTHDVVVTDDVVLAPVVREAVTAVRELVRSGMHPVFCSKQRGGALTAIDVREALDDEARAMVTLVLLEHHGFRDGDLQAAARVLCNRAPDVASVAVSEVRAQSVQMLGLGHRIVAGQPVLPDRIGVGVTYQLAAHGSFVQAHRETTRAIHAQIIKQIDHSQNVLELYAGSGALGLTLAAEGVRVTSVEVFASAVSRAIQAAQEQGLDSLRSLVGDAYAMTSEIVESGQRFDVVIVNPPRRGLPAELRGAIGKLGPTAIGYVSCEPETLARDMADLARMGYRATQLQPFDMMPQTNEVETFAWMTRDAQPPARVIYEDETILVVEKLPHEPTTPQGEHAFCLFDRVRALPNAREATPVHRLDAGTSGVCLFARKPSDVAPWSAALAAQDSEKIYVGLALGEVKKRVIRKDVPERGGPKSATTEVLPRERVLQKHTLLQLSPHEGRQHQLRRHLQMIRHPLLGDERYGHQASNRHFFEKYVLDRTFLHCERISLTHPHTGERITFEAALPGDLQSVLARCKSRDTSSESDAT